MPTSGENGGGAPAPDAQPYEFVVTIGPGRGTVIPVPMRRCTLGSDSTCAVRFEDPSVLPQHAEIAPAADGMIWIRDLSEGATRVNGTVVATQRLRSGNYIRLGSIELAFRRRQGAAPAVSGAYPAQAPTGFNPAIAQAARGGSGPNDTVMRPSNRYPSVPEMEAVGSTTPSGRVRASGPNDTVMRPSNRYPSQPEMEAVGSATPSGRVRASGPNDTVMRPSNRYPSQPDMEPMPESGPAPIESTSQSTVLPPGHLVSDRFEVVRKLAAGGMGEVYEVKHVELGKTFALKVMRPEFSSDPEFVERFKREAISSSRIGHHNIIDIYDFGRTANGRFYFVMEYLAGITLADLLRRDGPQKLERVAPIGLQICRALSAAHKLGIVHRDLKPENVFLLERQGRRDFVKVLDFGVAKVSHGQGQGGQTALGIVVGTPQYMSPEQASGLPVDLRSDVYSLGLILYEMLCGRPVFEGTTPSILMASQITKAPPPMEPGPLSPLPPELTSLVMAMLEKDPNKRPQTADEVAGVLTYFVSPSGMYVTGELPAMSGLGPATPGRVPSVRTHSAAVSGVQPAEPAPAKRLPVLPLALGAVLLVGGAGGGAYFLASSKPPPPPQIVVQQALPTPPPDPPKPPERPKAALVKLVLTSKPERVDIYEGEYLIGQTPFTLEWEKGKPANLRFVLDGYRPESRALAPKADGSIQVELKRVRSSKPTRPAGGKGLLENPYEQEEDLKESPY